MGMWANIWAVARGEKVEPDRFGKRSSRWPAVRREHLRLHPGCAVCGCLSDVEVHHIVPYHEDPSRELDPDNLLTLGSNCSSGNHHLLFGHLDKWDLVNPTSRADAAAWREKYLEARRKN